MPYSLQTFFEEWPAYNIKDKTLCARLISLQRSLHSIATHRAMTEWRFTRGRFVLVQHFRISNKSGAWWFISSTIISHLKSIRLSRLWLRSTDWASWLHSFAISPFISWPILWTTCSLICLSSRHLSAIVSLLPLAIALPSCLRDGVRL